MHEGTKSIEKPVTKNEKIYNAMKLLLEAAQDHLQWGGDEDGDGNLEYGHVNFSKLRTDLAPHLAELEPETQSKIVALLDSLERGWSQPGAGSFTEVMETMRSYILGEAKHTQELTQLSTELESFVNETIIAQEFDSKARNDWGFALRALREGRTEDVLKLLIEVLQKEEDEARRENIKKYIDLLSR